MLSLVIILTGDNSNGYLSESSNKRLLIIQIREAEIKEI